MDRELIITILKIVGYAVAALLSYFTAISLVSCSAYRSADSYGKTTIIVTDTTVIDHKGTYDVKIK